MVTGTLPDANIPDNLTIDVATAVPASGLTGSTLASGVTASSLTSVGTLTSLTSSGGIIATSYNLSSSGTFDWTLRNSGSTLEFYENQVAGAVGLSVTQSGHGTFRAGLTIGGNFIASGTGSHTFAGNVLPSADNSKDLGSSSYRWANLYVGDLNLKNDRGDWTVIEEEKYLSLKNNKNGKTYKIVMEED